MGAKQPQPPPDGPCPDRPVTPPPPRKQYRVMVDCEHCNGTGLVSWQVPKRNGAISIRFRDCDCKAELT